MKPRIVTAQIGPIRAQDIRFPWQGAQLAAVDADPKHPITLALMQNLPKLDDQGLRLLKQHMESHDYRLNSMSKKEDVESWILMVNNEIIHRQKETQSALASLLSHLSPLSQGAK